MRLARFFIYGVPALLIALFVAAFVNSTQLTTRKKNEFTYGSIGEPSKINPLQSSEQSASEVEGMIFEALLKFNDKLELATQLATAYDQSQRATVCFRTPELATAAAAAIHAGGSDLWKAATLQSAVASGDRLVLTQTLPGLRTIAAVERELDPGAIVPLVTMRADLGRDARRTLAEFRRAHPDVVIEREWFDYDIAFEITARDPGRNPLEVLTDFLRATKIPNASASLLSRRNFLAEPILKFSLRKNVRWQDGEPFTAKDCVFTYDCLMDEQVASPRKADYDPILKVEAPGPYEFVVTYRRPYSTALLSWTMPILPEHVLRGKPQKWWAENFNRHPIGTGPFKFDSWRTNEFVRLVKNPIYWGAGPWLDAFVFRALPDPTVLRLAFETHQLDIYPAVLSPWAIRSYHHDPRFTVLTVPAFAYTYVGWNLKRPMFQDLRVRKAFALAVNVPDIIKFVAYGNGTQSTGIFIPDFWFADSTIRPLPCDPALARRLLDEAGWKPGPDGIRVKDGQRLSFKLITNQGNDVRKDVATLVQDSLRKVGAEVTVEIYEWAVFIQRFVLKQEFDALVLAWQTPPNWDEFQVWHSSQTHPDQLNSISYKNPEADRLIEALREEYDHAEIKKLAGKLQRVIYDDQPMLFLNVPRDPYVIWKDSLRIRRPTDHGWVDTPFQVIPGAWNYFSDVTYRPDYADLLPKSTAVAK